jgi:hypothetical protein
MSNGNFLDVSKLLTDHIPPLLTPHAPVHVEIHQRAIEIVQKAIDEDVSQNYAEAYKQYQNALDYFMMALKCAHRSAPMLTGPSR